MTLSEMSGATFSHDRAYRHLLWRRWSPELPWLNVIGVNPSVADHIKNDPTITRQIERAKILKCGGLLMSNAYDFVSTDPNGMKNAALPLSEFGDQAILDAARMAFDSGGYVICAWGNNCSLVRQRKLLEMLNGIKLHCLGVNGNGTPQHPLYIPYTRALREFGKA